MQPSRLFRAWTVSLFALVGFLMFPKAVAAQLHVSPPTISISAQTSGGSKTSDTFGDLNSDYQQLGSPDTLQHAEASLLNLGAPIVPYLFADAEASGEFTGANASASVIYQIQLSGPLNIGIPIIVHVGALSTTVSRSGGGIGTVAGSNAYLTISNDDASFNNTFGFSANYTAHAVDQFGSPFDTSNNFVTDTHLTTRANADLLTITMDTITRVSSSYNASVKANAQLDPYIYIDPSFPDAALYSIQISPGIANTPVPEPATLLPVALGALALVRRRSLRSRP